MQALGYDNRIVAFDAEALKAVSIASTKVLHLPGHSYADFARRICDKKLTEL